MKAGIIGLGHGARVLIHSFRLSKINVYGITSRNYVNAKRIGKENNIANIYKTWQDLIRDKKIKIIAIAVPPVDQIDILNECIKQNKLILSEKPIGINLIKINNIFFKLSNYKNLFLVDYIFPEHGAFKKFKKIIDSKKTYKDDYINIKFTTQTYINKFKIKNWKSETSQGGGIINLFLSHIIDYLIIYFGKILKVKCVIKNKNKFEESLICNIEFISGIKANICINTNNSQQLHSISYYSKNFHLILKNKGKDYCRNFKILYYKIQSKNKLLQKEINYNDKIKKFKEDSRIILTSRIINKFKKKFTNYNLKNNLKRFSYDEYIFNKCRISAMKKNNLKINE